MERIDVAIVGGGIIGLATAFEVAKRGATTCLFEKRPRPGLDASTHNSGVIHAGIYYPSDSLKASLCISGREQLYRLCHDHDIPHERCGKLIVASDTSEISHLETLAERGRQNGVEDLEIVDRSFIKRLEPHVEGVAAIWSPSTGIVEAEALVRKLTQMASREVYLLPATSVTAGTQRSNGIEIETNRERILAQVVVNAAGLYADEVSARLGGEHFTIYPVRGDYVELTPKARHLVNRPVYPVPDSSGYGLGLHFTRTTWGSVMLGPTSQYQTAKDDYENAALPIDQFHESARQLLPDLDLSDLRPGGTGIRARPAPATQEFADFIIRADTLVPTLIHAVGIDSPGLTSCLSIAKMVAQLVEAALD